MAKIITITLGGVERRLDVGKFLFNQYLEEYLKGKESSTFDYSVAIIYAGLMVDCKVNKVEPDFTKESISEAVGLEDTEVVAKWMEQYAAINKKPGE